jgi:hypothetical protein
MRQRQRLFLAVAAVAVLALAGCGRTVVAVTTATATLFPTATPTPSPTVTPIPTDCVSQLNHAPNLVHSGDLLVSMEFSLAYPSHKLPDNIPLAPYKMTADLVGKIPPDPSVNPHLDLPTGGYYGTVCNASASATHTLTGLSLRIASFTPYSGQVNQWQVCSGSYGRPNGVQGGGCGGGVAAFNCTQASFPAGAGAGATTPLAPLAATGCNQVGLSHALQPGMDYGFNLGIVAPTAPGTYTFSLGISLDGATPVYVPVPHQLLLDSSARTWDGQSCTTPAMQSQIPANDTSAYICPAS